jgi:hypothetical protein
LLSRTPKTLVLEEEEEEEYAAGRTAPPPPTTTKEDVVIISREHHHHYYSSSSSSVYRVKVFPTIDEEVSRGSSPSAFRVRGNPAKIRCCERERRATPTIPSKEENHRDQHSKELKANTTLIGGRNKS